MTDLTPIFNAVIALLAALITAFVIPWLKRKTNAQDREDLLRWVEIAVAAAEQLWDSTQGEEKKKAVMAFLREKGFTFTESEIDSAIEAAVLKLVCAKGLAGEYRARLRENVSRYRDFISGENYSLLMELDNEFHRLIFEAGGKLRTYQVVHRQMIHFDRLRALSLQTSLNSKTLNDHENILYAMEKQDGELAELVMTQHLARHQVEKEELCRRYPDYFVFPEQDWQTSRREEQSNGI